MLYLDYAATSLLRPEVLDAVSELGREPLGNPSSLHQSGRRARHHLESARERCARALGAQVEEIVFCSGATEADNLALHGVIAHPDNRVDALVTSALEHAAVYSVARRLEEQGFPVEWLPVTAEGLLQPDDLQRALAKYQRPLVAVMACNNEVGSLPPVEEFSALCRAKGALLLVDAAQDPHRAARLVRHRAVDLLCLSGHKLGGLPGGLLYVRQGVALRPQILGGAQEDHRRAGTSEVLRSVSLALALEQTLAEDPDRLRQLRQRLEQELLQLPDAHRLGPAQEGQRAPHISSWLFGELAAEPILAQLDLRGICASSGSACSSHAVEPSRVVRAMGWEQAMGLVRFSLGWGSQADEVQRAASQIKEVVHKIKEKVKR